MQVYYFNLDKFEYFSIGIAWLESGLFTKKNTEQIQKKNYLCNLGDGVHLKLSKWLITPALLIANEPYMKHQLPVYIFFLMEILILLFSN